MQLIACTLFLVSLVDAPAAHAADWSWEEDPVQTAFDVDPDGLPGQQAAWQQALEEAARSWNVWGAASVTLRVSDAPAGAAAPGDGRNTVDAGSGSGTGVIFATALATGEAMEECDLRVLTTNGAGPVSWSLESAGATSGSFDAERALVHGLGLCLGLGLSEDADSVMQSPAAGSGADLRTPSPGDATALQGLYGAAAVGMAEYSHAVLYDVEDRENGDGRAGPGEQVLFRVRLINEGDPAWGLQAAPSTVSSTATLTWITESESMGDVDHGAFGDATFVFQVDTCDPNSNPTTVRLDLTDERGDIHAVEIDFPLQCAGSATPEPEPTGCGCATGGRGGVPGALWLVAFALRRRRTAS